MSCRQLNAFFCGQLSIFLLKREAASSLETTIHFNLVVEIIGLVADNSRMLVLVITSALASATCNYFHS